MNNLKCLILLLYCARPKLVLNALESISESTYKNWELAVIDDSAVEQEKFPIHKAKEILTDNYHLSLYNIHEPLSLKQQRGSIFGSVANEIMLRSNSDICFILCDDDCVTPWYMEQLNQYYLNNPEVMYSYCDVIVYNPLIENWKDKLTEPASDHFLNHNHNPHPMGNSKDSSQGSWRLNCIKEGGVRFPSPMTIALDYYLWNHLYQVYGNGVYNGIIGQLKGYHAKQLGSTGSYINCDKE